MTAGNGFRIIGRTLAGAVPQGTSGNHVVTVSASDGTNPPVTKTFTFSVTDADPVSNDGQAAYSQAATNPGVAITTADLNQYFTEPNGQPMTYRVSAVRETGGAQAVVGDWTGLVSGTELRGNVPAVPAGTYELTIAASDGGGVEATRTFTIIVSDMDPQATANQVPPGNYNPGDSFSAVDFSNGYFTDGNGPRDVLTYSVAVTNSAGQAVAGNLGLSISNAAGTRGRLSGDLPDTLAAGTYTVTVSASYGEGTPATQTFDIVVRDVDPVSVPTATQADYSQGATAPGSAITVADLDDYFSDANGDAMTYEVTRVTETGGGQATLGDWTGLISGSSLTGNAPNVAAGTYQLEISASDAAGTPATRTFTIIISAPAQQPAPPAVNVDGTGTAQRDDLRGDDDSNTFLIDNTRSVIGDADIIRNFNSGAAGNKDEIRLEHDGEDANTTQVNIWYKLADLDGGGTANDMVVYNDVAGGDANVLVILQNYDTVLTNDDFHEDVTLVEATNAATTADIL